MLTRLRFSRMFAARNSTAVPVLRRGAGSLSGNRQVAHAHRSGSNLELSAYRKRRFDRCAKVRSKSVAFAVHSGYQRVLAQPRHCPRHEAGYRKGLRFSAFLLVLSFGRHPSLQGNSSLFVRVLCPSSLHSSRALFLPLTRACPSRKVSTKKSP